MKCYKKEFSKINKKFRCNFFLFRCVPLYFFFSFCCCVFSLFVFSFLFYIFIFSSFLLFFVSPFSFSFSMLSKNQNKPNKKQTNKTKTKPIQKTISYFLSQKSFLKSLQCSRCNLISRSFCERRFFFFSFFLCEIIIIF